MAPTVLQPGEDQAVLADFDDVLGRIRAPDRSSAGCTTAIVAIVALVLVPTVLVRVSNVSNVVVLSLGAALFLTALVSGVWGIFGGRQWVGLPADQAVVEQERAVETLRAYPAGRDREALREAAILLVVHGSRHSTGPGSQGPAEIAERLGQGLEYALAVEHVLVDRGKAERFLTRARE